MLPYWTSVGVREGRMARRWVLVTNLYRVQLPRPAPGLLLNAVAPRVCVVAPRSMCSKKSKARLSHRTSTSRFFLMKNEEDLSRPSSCRRLGNRYFQFTDSL